MIHIRIDHERENSKRRFACGIGPELPADDKYFFWGEPFDRLHYHVTCPQCRVACGMNETPRQIGIPLSQVTGQDLDRMAREWRGE